MKLGVAFCLLLICMLLSYVNENPPEHEFYEFYKTTSEVSIFGHRVRSNNSLVGDDIGTIRHNSTIRIERVEGNWGKLHHTMKKSFHNKTEGWVLMNDEKNTYFDFGVAEGIPVDPTPHIVAMLAGTTVAGGAVGAAVVAGAMFAVGLSVLGPIAGGWFAANMGAGLTAGSMMSTLQSIAMGTAAYTGGAGVGVGVGGVGAVIAYRWRMTG